MATAELMLNTRATEVLERGRPRAVLRRHPQHHSQLPANRISFLIISGRVEATTTVDHHNHSTASQSSLRWSLISSRSHRSQVRFHPFAASHAGMIWWYRCVARSQMKAPLSGTTSLPLAMAALAAPKSPSKLAVMSGATSWLVSIYCAKRPFAQGTHTQTPTHTQERRVSRRHTHASKRAGRSYRWSTTASSASPSFPRRPTLAPQLASHPPTHALAHSARSAIRF
jgi:hypothetical protein